MTRPSTATILILLALGCTPSNSGSEKDNFESIVSEFERQIEDDLKTDNIDGSISAAITRDDRIVWSKAFGYSDKGSRTLADASTIYRTGSITKSFTAFLLMQLVEEGVIKLTDPIELYLPEIKQLTGYSSSTRITFLQLATHSAGLIREPELEGAASGPIENWENKIIESISQTSFKSQPGKEFSYSNIGYGILGLALSRAANQPFTELVTDKIFIPLKMNSSYFVVPIEMTSRLATGMAGGPGDVDIEIPIKEHAGRGYKVPNGGIYSTPNDLAKFVIANLGYQKLLRPENLEFMQTVKAGNYGLGFFIAQNRKMTIIDHGGAVAGYSAQLSFEKTSKYGVVIMRNYNFGATDLFAQSNSLLMDLTELEKEQTTED